MNEIITAIGRAKMAQARAGVKALPPIAGMAFGTGGVAEGVVQPPGETLQNEVFRKAIDGYECITEQCYRYKCTLDKEELSGSAISEVGLYDTEGDLVGIKNFAVKQKDEDMEMIFEIDDQF